MGKSILLWAFVILIEILFVIAFVDRPWVERQIRAEYTQTSGWLGAEAVDVVYQRADRWFRSSVVESGLLGKTYEMFIPSTHPTEMQGKPLDEGFAWFEERLAGFWSVVYRAFQRASLVIEWFPYVLLIMTPAAVDGWTQRAVKRETFGYASPVRYQAAVYAFIGLVFAPLAYMLFPAVVVPQLIPLWAVATALVAILLAANVQKVL